MKIKLYGSPNKCFNHDDPLAFSKNIDHSIGCYLLAGLDAPVSAAIFYVCQGCADFHVNDDENDQWIILGKIG